VPLPDELFGQPGNHTLGAPVGFRRNGLIKGSDLCDTHFRTPMGNIERPVPAGSLHLGLRIENGAAASIFLIVFVAPGDDPKRGVTME